MGTKVNDDDRNQAKARQARAERLLRHLESPNDLERTPHRWWEDGGETEGERGDDSQFVNQPSS
jgi:hypothetical protein